MIFDRPKFLQKVIQDKDNPGNSLSQSLEYKLIASKISDAIKSGAEAYMNRHNRTIAGLSVLLAIIIYSAYFFGNIKLSGVRNSSNRMEQSSANQRSSSLAPVYFDRLMNVSSARPRSPCI